MRLNLSHATKHCSSTDSRATAARTIAFTASAVSPLATIPSSNFCSSSAAASAQCLRVLENLMGYRLLVKSEHDFDTVCLAAGLSPVAPARARVFARADSVCSLGGVVIAQVALSLSHFPDDERWFVLQSAAADLTQVLAEMVRWDYRESASGLGPGWATVREGLNDCFDLVSGGL